jgi:hypothetical protein
MPGADRTRCHPTSRSPGHRVPDLCDHPRSSAPGLLLLPRSSSLHVMPHLPPAHHETSKCDSPNETKIKEKQNETILDSNSNLAKSMTHHNQTKERTTWFLMDNLWVDSLHTGELSCCSLQFAIGMTNLTRRNNINPPIVHKFVHNILRL